MNLVLQDTDNHTLCTSHSDLLQVLSQGKKYCLQYHLHTVLIEVPSYISINLKKE